MDENELENYWKKYLHEVYLGNVSEVQRADMRRLWYASAWSALLLVRSVRRDNTAEKADKYFELLIRQAEAELNNFVERDKKRN